MKTYYCLLALTLISLSAWSQTVQMAGQIRSVQGSPVPFATVTVKGTSKAVSANETGNFIINAQRGSILVVTAAGYQTQEAPVEEESAIAVSLESSNLNEVVVVGYGQAQKRNVSGSISKVLSKEIENQPVQSFESALQGKAAGVFIENSSGKLGQGIKVRIRGTSSISASSQPLYVVDGVPLTTASQSDLNNEPTNPLIDLNPNDIESIEILKDASAAAIYGARASNGVVLITTKKGTRNDQTTVELNTTFGFSSPTKKRGFLNTREYVQAIRTAATNDGRQDFLSDNSGGYATEQEAIDDYVNYYETEVLDFYALGTDWKNEEVDMNWENETYRNKALSQQYDLSVRGGNAKTRFYVSGFVNDQEAIVIVNRFKRYGGRFNLDHSVNDKFSVGMNTSITRSQLDRVTSDNSFSTPGQLSAQIPVSPLIDPSTGEINANTLYANGLYDAKYNSDKQVTFRTIGNVFGNYNFTSSLSFRTEFGADILNMNQQSFADKRTQGGNGVGIGENFTSQDVTFNTNNYFTYKPRISDKFDLSVLLGMSYLQNDAVSSSQQAEEYPSGAIKNLSGATNVTFGSSANSRYNFLSYFFRSNMTFDEKYLLGFSVRADGSSRFGKENRYGYFPAISAGWILSEENFLSASNTLSYLKLRASWGQTGNAEIGELQYLELFSVSNYPSLPGFIPTQLGDPGLKWEKSIQTDIGVEFGLFNNRISGEIDVYNKQTRDLLLAVNVPATNGYFDNINYLNQIFQNVGSLENKGVEVTLKGTIFSFPKFRWTSSVNFAVNRNKVTDLNGQIIDGGGGSIQRAVEGQPIGAFFMQKFIGVDPQTGDALYLDADGKPTNDYNDAERQIVGDPNPDFSGGFTNTFSFNGLDLSVFFTFVQGNDIYNEAGRFSTSGFGNGFDNQTKDILNAWSRPGDITNVPRSGLYYSTGERTSSRWIYNGSYIRLRQLVLGYNLPATISNHLKIKGARFFIAGTNLWTKTDYLSDPEVNTLGTGITGVRNISAGVDFYSIPQPKTIAVGLNVRF